MKNLSIGRFISITGIVVLWAGLLLDGFGVISNVIFRVIMIVGVILQAIALFFILKRNEF